MAFPLFLSVLQRVPEERRQRILIRELLISLVILLGFLFAGPMALRLLGLSNEAVSIGGGLILFLIALRMVFPPPKVVGEQTSDTEDDEPFIVPLAIPLLSGPSALASLLLMQQSYAGPFYEVVLALILAWAGTALILLASGKLFKLLQKRGLIAIERLMGMVLVAIAVQMLLDGIKAALGT